MHLAAQKAVWPVSCVDLSCLVKLAKLSSAWIGSILAQAVLRAPPEVAFAMRTWPLL